MENLKQLTQRTLLDSTTALKAVSDAGALIHGRRTYELNTFRDTKEGRPLVGTWREATGIIRLQVTKRMNSNLGCLDACTKSFDMSFGLGRLMQNYRNRSTRSRGYGTHESVQQFPTNITKRSEMHKGFYISFGLEEME